MIDWETLYQKDAWDEVLKTLPELSHMVASPQNPKYHYADVWTHTKDVLRHLGEAGFAANPIVMASGLLHDAGKGLPGVRGINKEGFPSDIGHEKVSAAMVPDLLPKIAPELTAHEIYAVTWLVARHMKLIFPLPDGERKAVAFATVAYDELTPKGLDASAMLTWLLALYRADMLSTVFGRDPQSVIDVNRRVEALGAIFSRALS